MVVGRLPEGDWFQVVAVGAVTTTLERNDSAVAGAVGGKRARELLLSTMGRPWCLVLLSLELGKTMDGCHWWLCVYVFYFANYTLFWFCYPCPL